MNVMNGSILFMGIGFYDYESNIQIEIQKKGYKVHYINTVTNSFVPRLLSRIKCNKLSDKLRNRLIYRQILLAPDKVDKVVIIIGDNLYYNHFELLKKKYPSAPIILYLWDDIKRVRNFEILQKYTDSVLTFDSYDAREYNYKLRPLFYRTDIASKFDKVWDVAFIGWHHSVRYKILHDLKKILNENNVTYKFILVTRPWLYFWDRFIKRSIDPKDSDFFVFHDLNYNNYLKILGSSNVMIDIQHPGQKGLTMRTIETLASTRKIMTTNAAINEYDFDQRNIYVLGEKISDIDISFFKDTLFYEQDMRRYTLSQFVDDVLNG